jgi:hypothetical protein
MFIFILSLYLNYYPPFLTWFFSICFHCTEDIMVRFGSAIVELIYVLKGCTFFKRYFKSMQSHLMEKHFLGIIPSYMGRIFFENCPIPSHAENVALNFDHIRDILISLIQLDKFMVLPIANINWWYSCHEHRPWYATFYPFFFPSCFFLPRHLSLEYVSPSYSDWDTWMHSKEEFSFCLSFF